MAFELSYAYLSAQDDKIEQLKKELSEEDVNLIWDKINKKRINYDKLEGYVEPLDRLKVSMMNDVFYLSKITNEKIILFGKEPKWCLVAFQGLIIKNGRNPFPVKEVVALGKENEKIAENILKEFKKELGYFEVSAQWAKRHANLRASIAKTWRNHLANYPLTSAEQKFVQGVINELKKYDEFKVVDLHARKSRDGGPVNCEWEAKFSDFFMTVCVGSAFVGGAIIVVNVAPPVLFYLQANALELGTVALTSMLSYARQRPY